MPNKKETSLTGLANAIKQAREGKVTPKKTNKKQTPVESEGNFTSEEVLAVLKARAEAAAEAQDAAREAEVKAKVTKKDLLEFMEHYKVTSIPMPDRSPIRYKPASEKKDVTKGGLETALGSVEAAAEIWKKLPMKETKASIEIPDKTIEEISE